MYIVKYMVYIYIYNYIAVYSPVILLVLYLQNIRLAFLKIMIFLSQNIVKIIFIVTFAVKICYLIKCNDHNWLGENFMVFIFRTKLYLKVTVTKNIFYFFNQWLRFHRNTLVGKSKIFFSFRKFQWIIHKYFIS